MNYEYQLTVAQIPEGFLLLEVPEERSHTSNKYRILDVNSAFEELTNLHAEELISKNILDFFPDAGPIVRSAISRTCRDDCPVFSEYYSKVLGRVLELTCFRCSAEHFAFLIIDITDQKKAESVLAKAKQAIKLTAQVKANFLSNMNHEVRTPLNGMMGAVELLRETQLNDEQIELLEMAQFALKRLQRFMENVLDLSAAKSEMILVNEPLNINELLGQLINPFNPLMVDKEIEISTWIDSDIPSFILGDYGMIHKVLSNVMDNAIKYTKSGSVKLDAKLLNCSDKHCKILFSVADTGIGVHDEMINRLFRPFTQASEGFNRAYDGAGIGLAISKKIVDVMGGTLAIESEISKGTTVYISLLFELAQHTVSVNDGRIPRLLKFREWSEKYKKLFQESSSSGKFI